MRNENLLKVRDPHGEIFELPVRNARDHIQNLGWEEVIEDAEVINPLVVAPRDKPSKHKLEEAQKVAEAQINSNRAKVEKRHKPRKLPAHTLDGSDIPIDVQIAEMEKMEANRGNA